MRAGRCSRETLGEIGVFSERFGLGRERLEKASILSAKVDSSCIQAGYELYHHSFLFDERGNWAVIQQGMNDSNSYARRYHWFNSGVFVDSPPLDIAGKKEERALNLVSGESKDARTVSVDLINDNPMHFKKHFTGQMLLTDDYARFPARHDIVPMDLTKKDWEILNAAYEIQPENYEELISIRGMGKKKIRALALLAKLIYGSVLDWKDPVKYSFAHGGKDGIPFPVDRNSYENSISFLRDILLECRSSSKDRALKMLASLV